MSRFKLVSSYQPRGDQPRAIDQLSQRVEAGSDYQTLLGVTGSGKTFTIASTIERLNRPTLIISHNKTLAAQLYSEFKEFFPENAVEYFISYYDYYQPEAYIPQTDTYIEKDSSINDRIDRLRLAATTSLMSRWDVIVVASVSCIYNLGSPEEYRNKFILLRRGDRIQRDELLTRLIHIQYERNDIEFLPKRFRVRGDTVEIFPAYEPAALRVEFFGDEIERISRFDPISLKRIEELEEIAIYPAKHFLVDRPKLNDALGDIYREMDSRAKELQSQGKLLEAQRIVSRTRFDMEMLKEIGYCHGVENYSSHLSRRPPGSRPFCLIDYFPRDFLTVIDESHVTLPQVRGMYNGDRARKQTLVEYGFRLPSCLDNRPLKFDEFEQLTGQTVYVSATPGDLERERGRPVVEQIIRPTGLLDPQIIVQRTENQIDDLIQRVKEHAGRKERVLVTTLTKRMAEDLSQYLKEAGLKTDYIHSELDAMDRVRVLRNLRAREFDCLVGVNLLREGLDLPEVSLVCVMDADKEGFLRSATSLIQVAGRAARHVNGKVVMYADVVTGSLRQAVEETSRRRKLQMEYNRRNNIKPVSISKAIKDWFEVEEKAEEFVRDVVAEDLVAYERQQGIEDLERQMQVAVKNLQFEKAILLRDRLKELARGEKKIGKKSTRGS